jgi:hypothetical protein
MKFAVLILYELRAINKTIEKYYKYLIDYYNADVFILCQNTFSDDAERLKLFNRNVKFVKMYDKPNPEDYFGKESNLNLPMGSGCWKTPGNLQIYINHNEMSKVLADYVNDYDYFIHLRIDIEILFNFPPPELFEQIPVGMYSFQPEYCRHWGGSGGCNFIHKNSVIEYFKSYYDLLTNNNYHNIIMNETYDNFNQEKLLTLSLEMKKLKIMPIVNLNYYYTCETLNDYTTWSQPVYHPVHNVICKYPDQCSEAFDGLNLWNKGYKWNYVNGEIKLVY